MAEEKKSEKKPRKPSATESWAKIWYDFSQATTIHGVRYIGEKDAACIRRMLWFLIVTLGISFFTTQVVGCLQNYYKWPMSVDMKINYNDSLRFPAVTICNQNAFRVSKAVDLGWHDMIVDLWDMSKQSSNVARYRHVNLTSKDLYTLPGHKKDDFIVRCRWQGTDCEISDFEEILTDHGLCYSFNYRNTNNTHRIIRDSGSQEGLRLTLNIEQYEYMIGPNDAAGVKLLVHDQQEIPLVEDYGTAVSPGAHAFVAIKLKKITNIGPPHGKCRKDAKLKYYRTYTIPGCRLERKLEKMLNETPDCRYEYMGDPNLKLPPVCNLRTLLSLWKQQAIDAKKGVHNKTTDLQCPIPCNWASVDPAVSLAQLTTYNKEHFIRDPADVAKKYLKARETVFQVDKTRISADKQILRKVNNRVNKLDSILNKTDANVNDLVKVAFDTKHRLMPIFMLHLRILNDFRTNFDNNYKQFWHALLNRVKYTLLQGYNDVIATGLKQFDDMVERNVTTEGADSVVNYEITKKRFVLSSGITMLGQLKNALMKNVYAFQKPRLLHERYSMYSEYTLLAFDNGNKDLINTTLTNIETTVQEYLENLRYVEALTEKNSTTKTDFHKAQATFEDIASKLEEQRIKFENFMETSDRKIDNGIEKLESLRDEVEQKFDDVRKSMARIGKRAHSARWTEIKQFVATFAKYVETRDVSRDQVARPEILRRQTRNAQKITTLFDEIKTMSSDLRSEWDLARSVFIESVGTLRSQAKHLLHKIYLELLDETPCATPDESVVEPGDDISHALIDLHYVESAATLQSITCTTPTFKGLQNVSLYINGHDSNEWSEKVAEEYLDVVKWSKVADIIGTNHVLFSEAFTELLTLLEEFQQGNKLDDTFIKENFIQLDIFMQELSYEEINQQEAYDWVSMLGDIGGSMGLFVGASCITLFEILDAGLHHFLASFPNFRKYFHMPRSLSQRRAPEETKEISMSNMNNVNITDNPADNIYITDGGPVAL